MKLLSLIAVASMFAPAIVFAQAAKQIPLRDFFRNPEQAAHQISDDGKYLSWLAPYERRLNVFVRPLAGGETVRVTSETARSIAGYFWKGDRIIFVKDFGGDENFHVVSVDLKGGDLKDLTPGEKLRANVEDILYDDPDHLILSHNRRDQKVFDVFRVDVKTGEEKLVAQNPGNITGWQTDHAGKLRVAVTTDGVNTSLLYRDREEDPFKPILTTTFKEIVAPAFFTFDDKKLYVRSNRGRDKTALFVFDPQTAKEGEMLFEHPEVDVTALSYSRKRKVLTAISYTTWRLQRKFLDAEVEAMFRDVEAQLPGYEITFTSTNRAEDKFIVGVMYSLYGGVATPSEAAGVGAAMCMILAILIYRLWKVDQIWSILRDTMRESVMILTIIATAVLFGYMLTSLYLTQTLAQTIADAHFNRWVLMLMINLFLLVCGFFIPPAAIILMTSPILLPIVTAAGFDPVWFGVILTINMEIGLIHPPVGLNIYIVNAIAPDVPIAKVMWGTLPYVLCMMLAIVILCVFPEIATWLPNHLMGARK